MARKKKKERSKIASYVILVMMIGLMIGSILSVALYAPPRAGSVDFAGQDFYITSDGLYATMLDGVERRFHTAPGQTAGVPYDPAISPLLRGATEIIIVFDPETPDAQLVYYDAVRFELRETIPNTRSAVTQASNQYTLPVVTCEQASPQTPVVLLTQGLPAVNLTNNCVVLAGDQSSLFLTKDTLLYNYFGLN